MSIARDTVASALASDGPPKYQRASSPSAIDEVEPRIRALLSAYPRMPATVIAEPVGGTGSISWFRERVRALRPGYLPADPVDRLEHPPGRVVQCDLWFPVPKIAVGFGQESMLPVLVTVAALGARLVQIKHYNRESKGMVERANRYLETSFLSVAPSPHRRTSMINLSSGFRLPTVGGCGSSTVVRWTSSIPIELRC